MMYREINKIICLVTRKYVTNTYNNREESEARKYSIWWYICKLVSPFQYLKFVHGYAMLSAYLSFLPVADKVVVLHSHHKEQAGNHGNH